MWALGRSKAPSEAARFGSICGSTHQPVDRRIRSTITTGKGFAPCDRLGRQCVQGHGLTSKGTIYRLKYLVLMTAIELGMSEQADLNRYIVCDLKEIPWRCTR